MYARGILQSDFSWQLEPNGPETILYASEIEERHRIGFWDAMIVAAAVRGGAERVLTEDLSHGQLIEGRTDSESICLTPRRFPECAKERGLLETMPTTRNTRAT